jgi:putative oxygen-independent coproporphyrinogen III oxidase
MLVDANLLTRLPHPVPQVTQSPSNGPLPEAALNRPGERPFGIYVHVPFCTTRCGYCDFNTYTARELGGGASQAAYAATAASEIRLARRILGDAELPVSTVFFGGGTPTVLPASDLLQLLRVIDDEFGLARDVEVTSEANPESVNPAYLEALRAGGFTRLSFGMQSARPHVLRVLDRVHTPGRPAECVAWAHQAGFEHVNLDLIYGTPGESDADWRASLDAALGAGPDHVSAYSLIVEDGTRLAARVRRGELPAPDDDVLADRYALADEVLTASGFRWYEVSNWAASLQARCRHNFLYWTGGDWWGIGSGAHSHVGSMRWWNVKHPRAYAERLAAGCLPVAGWEQLTDEDRALERIMLRLRLAEGLRLDALTEPGRLAATRAVAGGLLQPQAYEEGRAALTLRGRLLADAVVRDLAA